MTYCYFKQQASSYLLDVFFTDCTNNLDVCFVLDASGSIGEENFRKIKDFLGTVVDGMDVESRQVRVAATTFETKYVSSFF